MAGMSNVNASPSVGAYGMGPAMGPNAQPSVSTYGAGPVPYGYGPKYHETGAILVLFILLVIITRAICF